MTASKCGRQMANSEYLLCSWLVAKPLSIIFLSSIFIVTWFIVSLITLARVLTTDTGFPSFYLILFEVRTHGHRLAWKSPSFCLNLLGVRITIVHYHNSQLCHGLLGHGGPRRVWLKCAAEPSLSIPENLASGTSLRCLMKTQFPEPFISSVPIFKLNTVQRVDKMVSNV